MSGTTHNGWEPRYCLDDLCPSEDPWLVSQAGELSDLWLVAHHEDDRPFEVAAAVPGCPLCGSPLLPVVDIEEAIEEETVVAFAARPA